MSYTVYKHVCSNGKVYIGITGNNPIKRWREGYGYRANTHFYNAILKYGWDNIKHEILYSDLTKEEACEKEIELIALYKSNNPDYGYNHTIGGENPKLSEETKEKIRQANLGKKPLPETIEKRASKIRGRKYSDEHRKKLSEAAKQRGVLPETLEKFKHSGLGKPAWNSGKTGIYTDETRKRMSEAAKLRIGEKHPKSKKDYRPYKI